MSPALELSKFLVHDDVVSKWPTYESDFCVVQIENKVMFVFVGDIVFLKNLKLFFNIFKLFWYVNIKNNFLKIK